MCPEQWSKAFNESIQPQRLTIFYLTNSFVHLAMINMKGALLIQKHSEALLPLLLSYITLDSFYSLSETPYRRLYSFP